MKKSSEEVRQIAKCLAVDAPKECDEFHEQQRAAFFSQFTKKGPEISTDNSKTIFAEEYQIKNGLTGQINYLKAPPAFSSDSHKYSSLPILGATVMNPAINPLMPEWLQSFGDSTNIGRLGSIAVYIPPILGTLGLTAMAINSGHPRIMEDLDIIKPHYEKIKVTVGIKVGEKPNTSILKQKKRKFRLNLNDSDADKRPDTAFKRALQFLKPTEMFYDENYFTDFKSPKYSEPLHIPTVLINRPWLLQLYISYLKKRAFGMAYDLLRLANNMAFYNKTMTNPVKIAGKYVENNILTDPKTKKEIYIFKDKTDAHAMITEKMAFTVFMPIVTEDDELSLDPFFAATKSAGNPIDKSHHDIERTLKEQIGGPSIYSMSALASGYIKPGPLGYIISHPYASAMHEGTYRLKDTLNDMGLYSPSWNDQQFISNLFLKLWDLEITHSTN